MKTIEKAAYEYHKEYGYSENSNEELAFEAGVEFAQKWISVEDELPEIKDERYQINVKYKSGIDIYDTIAIEPSICTKENLSDILNDLNITHWRPIERK